ncbi:hypothetical protein [Stappia sp. WLB 29]|uniref:hypothetical protein n=1 Tax=Stappia sp. WLB 29 TaxID=2925220 RepID=UPI0020BD8316|nr:hypothetical protein [Stappia sp. WLB 29]
MTKTTGLNWRRWRKVGVWIVGLPLVGAIASAVVLNPANFFGGLRAIPGEFRKTSDEFWGWYHNDAAWTGYWTNSPEGYVDAPDMNLSDESMVVDLIVEKGVIDGTISTKPICGATPFNEFFLVRGTISGSKSATIIVWDIFQGDKADIAKLELRRDGVILTVVPKEGTTRLFPKEARLALDPTKQGSTETGRGEFCEGKREDVVKSLSETAKDAAKK